MDDALIAHLDTEHASQGVHLLPRRPHRLSRINNLTMRSSYRAVTPFDGFGFVV